MNVNAAKIFHNTFEIVSFYFDASILLSNKPCFLPKLILMALLL